MPSLIQHQKSTKHCPCPRCDPFDGHEALVEARLPPPDKYSCSECKRRFAQKPSLEAHQRESLHVYCYNCDIVSPTRELHALHMQSHQPPSAIQFRCCDCERDFKDEGALTAHLRSSKVHGRQKRANNEKTKEQRKCKKCKKTFKNQAAISQHLMSVRHRPLSDIKCVADAECKKQFNCPSAQLHHLETGKCVSGMTKTKLNAAIAANDTGRIITSGGVMAQRLLEDNPSATSTSQSRSPLLTPTSTEFLDSYPSSAALTPISTLSNTTMFHSMLTLWPWSRPPSGYQTCPLCPPSRTRTFKHSALQQHLSSSVHAQISMSLPVPDNISFHCPRALMDEGSMKQPVKQFSTVSGLVQHLESGACNGGKGTFKRVVELSIEILNLETNEEARCTQNQMDLRIQSSAASLINYEGETIFDSFVCYPEPVIVTNTDEKYSGIAWNNIDPQNGAQPFSKVQAYLVELLRDCIVISHEIQKDLEVISMDLPPQILRLQGVALRPTPGPSLKNLALGVLDRPIKQGRVSSVEDAIVTMEVYRNAEADIEQEQGRKAVGLASRGCVVVAVADG
ncbi:hypothetical protein B7494_g6091 [Chlorociboria aeruginascens]|nr:hypothetical protein B7494_g6091 [Chlorociboria aeruginascens]